MPEGVGLPAYISELFKVVYLLYIYISILKKAEGNLPSGLAYIFFWKSSNGSILNNFEY